MPKLEKFISKIDHRIKFLNQIKSVLKKQFKLLKTLRNIKTNIPNEIKVNTSVYLRIFEEFELEYNKFFMQIEENYTSLKLFKEQLHRKPADNNAHVNIDDSNFEIGRVFNSRIKLPFWEKLLFCGCNDQTDERLIEMTECTNNLIPS